MRECRNRKSGNVNSGASLAEGQSGSKVRASDSADLPSMDTNSQLNKNSWFADSGIREHISMCRELFEDLEMVD